MSSGPSAQNSEQGLDRLLVFLTGEASFREFVTQRSIADRREDFKLLCPASSAIDERGI
jgi:hypothetical protein